MPPPESDRPSSAPGDPWSEPWAASRQTSSASVRAARRGRASGYARFRPRSPAGRSTAEPWLHGLTLGVVSLGFRLGGLARDDAVDPLTVSLLGFKREAKLLAHHPREEPTDRVLLPAGGLHDRR